MCAWLLLTSFFLIEPFYFMFEAAIYDHHEAPQLQS